MRNKFRPGISITAICAALGIPNAGLAQQAQNPTYCPQGNCQQLTPEQRQQMWENMHRWGTGGMMGSAMMGGYGPGYGMGMGPGMMWGPGYGQPMTPEQYRQWYERHQRGYGPGMMYNLTPEQRQQMWEQMHRQGYGPWWMQPPASSAPQAK